MEFPPVWEVLPNDAFLGYDATTPGCEFGAALLVAMTARWLTTSASTFLEIGFSKLTSPCLESSTFQKQRAYTPFSSARPRMRSRIWAV